MRIMRIRRGDRTLADGHTATRPANQHRHRDAEGVRIGASVERLRRRDVQQRTRPVDLARPCDQRRAPVRRRRRRQRGQVVEHPPFALRQPADLVAAGGDDLVAQRRVVGVAALVVESPGVARRRRSERRVARGPMRSDVGVEGGDDGQPGTPGGDVDAGPSADRLERRGVHRTGVEPETLRGVAWLGQSWRPMRDPRLVATGSLPRLRRWRLDRIKLPVRLGRRRDHDGRPLAKQRREPLDRLGAGVAPRFLKPLAARLERRSIHRRRPPTSGKRPLARRLALEELRKLVPKLTIAIPPRLGERRDRRAHRWLDPAQPRRAIEFVARQLRVPWRNHGTAIDHRLVAQPRRRVRWQERGQLVDRGSVARHAREDAGAKRHGAFDPDVPCVRQPLLPRRIVALRLDASFREPRRERFQRSRRDRARPATQGAALALPSQQRGIEGGGIERRMRVPRCEFGDRDWMQMHQAPWAVGALSTPRKHGALDGQLRRLGGVGKLRGQVGEEGVIACRDRIDRPAMQRAGVVALEPGPVHPVLVRIPLEELVDARRRVAIEPLRVRGQLALDDIPRLEPDHGVPREQRVDRLRAKRLGDDAEVPGHRIGPGGEEKAQQRRKHRQRSRRRRSARACAAIARGDPCAADAPHQSIEAHVTAAGIVLVAQP